MFGALIPETAVSHVKPADLNDDYKIATLSGKILNLVDDAPDADVATGNFKAIVTGNPVDGRHPFGKVHKVRNRAAFAFFFNEFPGTKDHDTAFWVRFLLLVFDKKTFRGSTDEVRDLHAQIVADELPGVARWALEGALRLVRTGKYTSVSSGVVALDEWRKSVDQIALFVDECCTPYPKGSRLLDLYAGYSAWATRGNTGLLSEINFAKRLRQIGYDVVRDPEEPAVRKRGLALVKNKHHFV